MAADDYTQEECNKHLIRRWLDNANQRFVAAFEDYTALDFVGHAKGTTIDFNQLKQLELAFAEAFPDAYYTIEDLIAEKDKVVLRVTVRGTHLGLFHGIPPSQRKVAFTGIVIYKIKNAKIAECWDEIDCVGLWKQITQP